MVSTQGQFPSYVFARGSDVEIKFEVASLAYEKSMGGQNGAVGIGDREAKFTGAVLSAGKRGRQEKQKRGVDEGAVQIDSPESAGLPENILQG
jgi:hypothetical protein